MEAILGGLEQGRFDAAIGAITITADRLERVDFSYPAHRSGVAVASRRQNGPLAVLSSYGAAVSELSSLILLIVAMLGVTGLAMWRIEKSHPSAVQGTESSVATLRDGLYWAVVTMTTIGYGDKTPKTSGGRAVAILWMFGSLVLISLLSTTLVSRLTAERVENNELVNDIRLDGEKLAAVEHSSGTEYLDKLRLHYTKYRDLPEALASLTDRRSDAVVNSVGALQYLISDRYPNSVELSRGLLAPAYMAFALPRNSALGRPIDSALIRITAGEEWRSLEARFFGR
jgi:polar amino acid transport system substrate-binding protein